MAASILDFRAIGLPYLFADFAARSPLFAWAALHGMFSSLIQLDIKSRASYSVSKKCSALEDWSIFGSLSCESKSQTAVLVVACLCL